MEEDWRAMSPLAAFCCLCKNLVMKDGMTQKELYSQIRKTLMEEATTRPKTRVAFNACYGGYGYSKIFEQYVASMGLEGLEGDHDSKEHRESVVPLFASFGVQAAKDHPQVASMLHRYVHWGLEEVFTELCTVSSYRCSLKQAKDNGDLLGHLGHFGAEVGPSRYDITDKKFPNDRFTRDSLQKAIDEAVSYYEGYISGSLERLKAKLGSEAVGLMEESLKHLYPEERADRCKHHSLRNNYSEPDGERIDFSTALTHYKEKPWAAWECQEHIDKRAIRFLLEHPGALHPPEGDPPYELIGLLFATGAYANLKVADVPAVMDWSIGDYDGYENVAVL